jgi:hypothetical protein
MQPNIVAETNQRKVQFGAIAVKQLSGPRGLPLLGTYYTLRPADLHGVGENGAISMVQYLRLS